MLEPLWRIVWRFLKKKIDTHTHKKTEIGLPYYSVILPLDIYPGKGIIAKHTHNSMFISALFTIASN